jgi:activating molecule in BECN1-regulated autophagy protein 1
MTMSIEPADEETESICDDEDDDDITIHHSNSNLRGIGRYPRRVSYPRKIWHEVRTFAEYYSVVKYHSAFLHHLGGEDQLDDEGHRPSSSRAVSTISVAFSPDAQTMASTHGDHTVKISCCSTGRLLQSLEGHPRTPWTVKYHPTDARIVASGCLGHQVRIWNWIDKACLQMVRLEFAIISLSFHPTGKLLAVANGTRLHFWGLDSHNKDQSPAPHNRSNVLTEIDLRHMLRCVHFPPDGQTIIVGGVNPTTTEDPRRRIRGGGVSSGGMSFYLRLWNFDTHMALQPQIDLAPVGTTVPRLAISNVSQGTVTSSQSRADLAPTRPVVDYRHDKAHLVLFLFCST